MTAALLAITWVGGVLYGAEGSAAPVDLRARAASSDQEGVFDHAKLDVVLARFVDSHGMVDYPGLAEERGVLDEYVAEIAAASPRSRPIRSPIGRTRSRTG